MTYELFNLGKGRLLNMDENGKKYYFEVSIINCVLLVKPFMQFLLPVDVMVRQWQRTLQD